MSDPGHLPFPDRSVDVVLSVLRLRTLPAGDRAVACREIARVLGPGGTAVLADHRGAESCARVLRDTGTDVRARRAPLSAVHGPVGVVVARR